MTPCTNRQSYPNEAQANIHGMASWKRNRLKPTPCVDCCRWHLVDTTPSKALQRRSFARAGRFGRPMVLNLEKAREIRSRFVAGESRRSLAVAFGVSASLIGRIINGLSWREK